MTKVCFLSVLLKILRYCHLAAFSHIGYCLDYQFALKYPIHPREEHLCVVEEQSEVTKLMEYLEDLKDKKPEKMGGVHMIWWHEVS